jgi:hypothetical protein
MSIVEAQDDGAVVEVPDGASPPFGQVGACIDISEQHERVSFGNVEEIERAVRVIHVVSEVDLERPGESSGMCEMCVDLGFSLDLSIPRRGESGSAVFGPTNPMDVVWLRVAVAFGVIDRPLLLERAKPWHLE